MPPEIAGELIIQYGFVGLSIVLLGILFWLIKRLIELQENTNKIISEHNEISRSILDSQGRMLNAQEKTIESISHLNNKIIARPCIASKE